jgi:hypothetical protein
MNQRLTEREIENSKLFTKMVKELARSAVYSKNIEIENRYLKWLIKNRCLLVNVRDNEGLVK